MITRKSKFKIWNWKSKMWNQKSRSKKSTQIRNQSSPIVKIGKQVRASEIGSLSQDRHLRAERETWWWARARSERDWETCHNDDEWLAKDDDECHVTAVEAEGGGRKGVLKRVVIKIYFSLVSTSILWRYHTMDLTCCILKGGIDAATGRKTKNGGEVLCGARVALRQREKMV